MGSSAAMAMGDNVLNALSDITIMPISSFFFVLSSFFGVWVGIKLNWLK